MGPRWSSVATGAATLTVVASAAWAAAVGEVSVAVPCALCGFAVASAWVVVRHDPTSPVGPALAWTSAAIAGVAAHVGALAALPWSAGAWPLNLAGLLALLLVFPDGRRRGRVWDAVPWVFGAATVGVLACLWGAQQVDGEVVGGPQGAWVTPVIALSLVGVAASLLLAAASQVVRYRSGDRRTRQQVRWLLVAGLVVVALLVGGWLAEIVGATLSVAYTPFLAATVTLVPAAVGIAIVRHDLFDVDRLLTAATAWVVTLLVSAAVFSLVVNGLGYAVSLGTGLTGGVAAFVVALVLLPLQRHVSALVGRVVDRDRHTAVAQVQRFAADVRAGRRQPEEIEAVLREVNDDPDLVVHLALPDGEWVRLDGTPTTAHDGYAIEAGGDVIATVVLGWGSRRANRRIADVASVAWVPLEVSRLRVGLRRALAETEASRHRLAEASAAERRRLERDLHDGAQQRIVATGMRLRLLQAALPVEHAAEVDAAVDELRDTVDELRRIAQGVRPSLLDDGLATALVAVKEGCPIPFDLHVGPLPKLDDVLSLTAYLVVTEAVANALKYAQASHLRVTVTWCEAPGRVSVEVADDGVGVAEDTTLTALRDRVASVGGTLEVRRASGTTITAVL